MGGVGEEWESGALRDQGMRAGPVPILSSRNIFPTDHAASEGAIAMPTTDDQEALERAREAAGVTPEAFRVLDFGETAVLEGGQS